MDHDDDITIEPIRGLPERLPEGERILWQGAPSWKALARRALFARLVAGWFVLLGGVTAWKLYTGEIGMDAASTAVTAQAVHAAIALGILAAYAWGVARTTVYTITNRRLVMRFGLALDLTVNLPFRQIANLDLRAYGDGTGDLAVALGGNDKLGYLHLWPNARPWRFNRPEPMLRAVPDAAAVGRLLADALKADLSRREALGEGESAIPVRTGAPRPLPAGGPAAVPAE